MALFTILTGEMSFLSLIVLPLPLVVRRVIYNHMFLQLVNSMRFRTIAVVGGMIVSLLLVDSWKRANIKVNPYSYEQDHSTTPIQILATRAYNQRNVYLSGFILYFGICIATVMIIIGKIIRFEDEVKKKKELLKDINLLKADKLEKEKLLKEIKKKIQLLEYEKRK